MNPQPEFSSPKTKKAESSSHKVRVGSHPRPHVRSAHKAAASEARTRLYPFGPQGQWSVLLSERELLQEEIDRGRRYLEHLRKDLWESEAIFGAWAASSNAPQASAAGEKTSHKYTMEAQLNGWLKVLDQTLGSVTKQLNNISVKNQEAVLEAEESMFALLRAAG